MVYFMEIYCDGGCRNNGYAGVIAAAAMYFQYRSGRREGWSRILPDTPRPTNQCAELTAIIMSLEKALQKSYPMTEPELDVTIKTDSQYAVNCLTIWKDTWLQNGWRSARGEPVVNRDLIEKALGLASWLENFGNLAYQWDSSGAECRC